MKKATKGKATTKTAEEPAKKPAAKKKPTEGDGAAKKKAPTVSETLTEEKPKAKATKVAEGAAAGAQKAPAKKKVVKKKKATTSEGGSGEAAPTATKKKTKKKAAAAAPVTAEVEEQYVDDFEAEEAYDDDFEKDDDEPPRAQPQETASTSQPVATTSPPVATTSPPVSVAKSPEDVREKAATKAKAPAPAQKQQPQRLPERMVIDLAVSKELSAAQKRVQRGAQLRKMVQLDASRTADLFDLPPMSQYDVYMQKYGRSNAHQAWTQTGWDDISVSVSTDPPDVASRACQFPDPGASSIRELLFEEQGADSVDPEDRVSRLLAKVAHSVSSERLPRFLLQASRVLELLLDEAAAAAAGVRSTFQVTAKWTSSLRRFSSPSYLFNRPVIDVAFSPTIGFSFVATYGPVHGDGFLRDRGFVCVWQAQDVEHPAHVLTCDGQPTCACFAATSPFLVVAGTAEGAVVLWDLREPMSAHESVKLGQRSVLLRRPTYSSDAQRKDNHFSGIVKIVPNETASSGSAMGEGEEEDVVASSASSKFAAVDENSCVSVWVAVRVSASGDSDPGLAPQGSIRLVRSAWFSPFEAGPDADLSLTARTTDICFNSADPNQYILATDTGQVVRGARFAAKSLFPRSYGFLGPAGTSLGVSPLIPGCFFAGYSDGTVRLFSLDSETPAAEWCGFVDAQHGVRKILWSPTRPCVFFVIDTGSSMHIFDATIKQSEPVLHETFAKMGASDKDQITASAISPSSIITARASGSIDLFALVKQLASPVNGESEISQFHQIAKGV